MSQFRVGQSISDIQVQVNEEHDQTLFIVTNTGGYHWILTTEENQELDHDHAQVAYPQMFLHSETSPDTNNTQWLGLYHDASNGRIQTGTGALALSASAGQVEVTGTLLVANNAGDEAGELSLLHDGVNGIISVDTGDIILTPATNLGSIVASGTLSASLWSSPNNLIQSGGDDLDQRETLNFATGGGIDIAATDDGIVTTLTFTVPATVVCFVAGTKITMVDKAEKNIEDVEVGEFVLGQDNKINEVIIAHRPMLDDKKLFAINDNNPFVTAEHPFMTTTGWKSISSEIFKIGNPELYEELSVSDLKSMDVLIRIDGTETVNFIEPFNAPQQQLYNFELDGNNTYYANGYLVHNKPHKDYADSRLQENISVLENSSVAKLSNVVPREFDWTLSAGKLSDPQKGHSYGLDAEEIIREFGKNSDFVWEDKDGFTRLNYWKFVPILIGAFQKQQEQIDILKKDLESVKKK